MPKLYKPTLALATFPLHDTPEVSLNPIVLEPQPGIIFGVTGAMMMVVFREPPPPLGESGGVTTTGGGTGSPSSRIV